MKVTFQTSLLLFIVTFCAFAEEKLPTLTVQDETYTNVTVISVTATDLNFKHSRGVANAKLKNLSPELQKHFKYDPDKGAQVEKDRAEANALFRQQLATNTPPPAQLPPDELTETPAAPGGDFVAPKLSAKSIRGQQMSQIAVEKWLTPTPDMDEKFLLIDFWATWCGPCRATIPALNGFQEKYKDRLVVIGISDETEEAVRKMTSPKIDYALAIDTKQRMSGLLEIKGIPHCLLIDPKGFVRYEGHPGYLDEKNLEYFLGKYSN